MATVQNTLIVIGDTTISTSINPSHVRKLQRLSKSTGISLSEALDRALNSWMFMEAPVYRAECRQTRRRIQQA
jgi:hypothetical protein